MMRFFLLIVVTLAGFSSLASAGSIPPNHGTGGQPAELTLNCAVKKGSEEPRLLVVSNLSVNEIEVGPALTLSISISTDLRQASIYLTDTSSAGQSSGITGKTVASSFVESEGAITHIKLWLSELQINCRK